MLYETDYIFEWTYHKPNSKFCYTKTAHFDTELERNKFALDWFSNNKNEIVLEFEQLRDVKT